MGIYYVLYVGENNCGVNSGSFGVVCWSCDAPGDHKYELLE